MSTPLSSIYLRFGVRISILSSRCHANILNEYTRWPCNSTEHFSFPLYLLKPRPRHKVVSRCRNWKNENEINSLFIFPIVSFSSHATRHIHDTQTDNRQEYCTILILLVHCTYMYVYVRYIAICALLLYCVYIYYIFLYYVCYAPTVNSVYLREIKILYLLYIIPSFRTFIMDYGMEIKVWRCTECSRSQVTSRHVSFILSFPFLSFSVSFY
jgi:hypothetical protein